MVKVTQRLGGLVLRFAAFCAALGAVIAMVTSRERSSFFVLSLVAKYSDLAAFKYFVIANVIVSVYSFLVLFLPKESLLWKFVVVLDLERRGGRPPGRIALSFRAKARPRRLRRRIPSTRTKAKEAEKRSTKTNSVESDQVWDVDSFDLDYESPDESPSETDEEELRRYLRHIYKSRGFLLDKEMVPKNLFQGWRPLNLDAVFKDPNLTGRDYMEIMARVAIDKYNQTKNKIVTLDHIVRAVIRMSIGVTAYITFMAKESPEGELVEYQAKTEIKVWQTKIHPILCRPTSSSER
ncbi:unnamed protein product [Brassica oleracea var. botrytis]